MPTEQTIVTDAEALLRIYKVLRDHTKQGEDFALELTLIADLAGDLEGSARMSETELEEKAALDAAAAARHLVDALGVLQMAYSRSSD